MTARVDTSRCPVPRWLPGGHVQTLYGALLAHHQNIHFVRERVETPDGDYVDVDWAAPALQANHYPDGQAAGFEPELARTAARRWIAAGDWPTLSGERNAVLLFHGLEGSSLSPYIQAVAHEFRAADWVVAAAHFRGCSGTPNRMARAYHSGDSEEIAFLIGHARQRLPQARWYAVGVSLGGNALLKYLGEAGEHAHGLQAAAAVSAPLDLPACGSRLSDTLGGRLYSRYFLRSLRRKIVAKAAEFPGSIDVLRTQGVRTLRDFDDLYTAPMHGFRNALDYWTRSASLPLLGRILVPCLVLNARNDPLIPEATLPGSQDVAPAVRLHQPDQGGHAAFVTGRFPGHLRWLPRRLLQFFDTGR